MATNSAPHNPSKSSAAHMPPAAQVELLSEQPPSLTRPLALLRGQSFAALWPLARHATTTRWDRHQQQHVALDQPILATRQDLLVVRQDGLTFGPGGDHPLADLSLSPALSLILPPERQWSPAGVQAYRSGRRPDPLAIFTRLCDIFDVFVDFDRSLGRQSVMCELCAAFVLSTWLSDSFSTLGYPWISGDGGDNQDRLFELLTTLSFLGTPVAASSDAAAFRDLASYGALLAFDLTQTRHRHEVLDATQRRLALAGFRRGATTPARDYDPLTQRWRLRPASITCPRLFSAFGPPDPQLAPRCLVVPLIRPGNSRRAALDLTRDDAWPHSLAQLRDDLWAIALAHLPALPTAEKAARADTSLPPNRRDPWRAVLAVAHWLQGHGAQGLLRRFRHLAEISPAPAAQTHAEEIVHLIVRALTSRCPGLLTTKGGSVPQSVSLRTADVIVSARLLLDDESPIASSELTPQRVGRLLADLRLPQVKAAYPPRSREWLLTAEDLRRLVFAYDVPLPHPPTDAPPTAPPSAPAAEPQP